MVLKKHLEETGYFNILSKDDGVPVVAFSLKDRSQYDEFKISEMLRRHGWIVPAYPMPPGANHIKVLRVVIRADFSRTLAERLALDIKNVLHELHKLCVNIKVEKSLVDTALDAQRNHNSRIQQASEIMAA